ncbi:MAG: maleylpyruvate isomerase family mycothiol-dependent enzyme [Nocardioides sp.]
MGTVLEDLAAEQRQLDRLLAGLRPDQWARPSACSGWTVADVVLHLAQTEEAVVAALRAGADASAGAVDWAGLGSTVEAAMAAYVDAERGSVQTLLARWRAAAASSLQALRAADPDRRVQWVTNAMKPASLATTRLAEHWTHGHDIADPLGSAYADTERLRHVAWLGHATLAYAFAEAGERPIPVRCRLLGPDGGVWDLGPASAEVVITGSGVDFCRVGARRLGPAEADLEAVGPGADRVLARLRNFAI